MNGWEQVNLSPAATTALGAGFFAIVLGSLAAWTYLGLVWSHGKPALRYEPRRSVPWTGFEVFALLILYFLLAVQLALVTRNGKKPDADARPIVAVEAAAEAAADDEPKTKKDKDDGRTEHPLITVIRNEPNVWAIIAAVLLATVGAPITEEFFFRLFLQGWLEKVERQSRARAIRVQELFPGILGESLAWLPNLFARSRRLLPGLLPVLLPAAFFAMLHFRIGKTPAEQAPTVLRVMLLDNTARLLATAIIVALVCLRTGATAADFGFVRGKFLKDVGIGLAAYFAVVIPVFAVNLAFTLLLPKEIAPDPIPLFLFALVLGYLYFRTHRIVPAIVLHMCLNGTSMVMLLIMAWGA